MASPLTRSQPNRERLEDDQVTNPQTMDELRAAIQAAWDGIPPNVFNKHLLSMAHRMEMVAQQLIRTTMAIIFFSLVQKTKKSHLQYLAPLIVLHFLPINQIQVYD
ncbi:hypothetical protein O181_106738 [Austropuccinia psidii MF-1]|uniref:Uncharacterized protein n=1 Tax=Austropuccinia psidii MF-1 TaxID=1389203 RepID=A0A9Q3JPJ5_9BASI|nr:hypothetical protein [Austropuccinia psidii MF-1]